VLLVDEAAEPEARGTTVFVRRWDCANRRDTQLPALVDGILSAFDNSAGAAAPTPAATLAAAAAAACRAARDALRVTWRATESDAGYYEEYPLRPEAPECTFYLRHGYCKCGTILTCGVDSVNSV
jgi:hypothetical protein